MPLYEGPGAVLSLLSRAREDLGRLNALVTFDKISPGIQSSEEIADFVLHPAPAENRGSASSFLKHWSPDLLIWVGGPFRPILLSEADAAGVPRVLVDARADALGSVTGTWVPGMSRALIGPFRHVLTDDEETARRLERMGIDIGQTEVVGKLDEDPDPPPCDQSERSRLAALIGSRPLWFAAEVPLEETATLLTAFRFAQRRAHRMMLILAPSNLRDGENIRERLAVEGLRVALRSAGESPDENTEILVADRSAELGLWLRLAPVTYLGGTISGMGCLHPYLPAALGSAIVHGPWLGRHEAQVKRLARAGAARPVGNAEQLGRAIETLMAPDIAAAMAHAGWTVVASNAAVSNRLTGIIAEVMDGVLS